MPISVSAFMSNSSFVTCASATWRVGVISHVQCFIKFVLSSSPMSLHLHVPESRCIVQMYWLNLGSCIFTLWNKKWSTWPSFAQVNKTCDVTTVGHVFHKCSFRLKPGPLILHRELVGDSSDLYKFPVPQKTAMFHLTTAPSFRPWLAGHVPPANFKWTFHARWTLGKKTSCFKLNHRLK